MMDSLVQMLSRLFPTNIKDPMATFRHRTLFLVLVVSALACCLLPLSALISRMSWSRLLIYLATDAVVIFMVIAVRRARNVERFACIGLILATLATTLPGIVLGAHSFVTHLIYFPFAIFSAAMTARRSYSRWVEAFIVLDILILGCAPFIVGFAPVPLNTTMDVFHSRVYHGILFASFLPLLVTGIRGRFYQLAKVETQRIQSGVEKIRHKTLLTHFANHIAIDIEAPLQRLEQMVAAMRQTPDAELAQAIAGAKDSIQSMSMVTDRYRRLSFPSYLQEDRGITLGAFMESIQHFSPESVMNLDASIDSGLMLRGEKVFTLQLIMCLGLMNAPIHLQVKRQGSDLILHCQQQPWNHTGISVQEFLREMQQMLDDIQASLVRIDNALPADGISVQIQIPFAQICSPSESLGAA